MYENSFREYLSPKPLLQIRFVTEHQTFDAMQRLSKLSVQSAPISLASHSWGRGRIENDLSHNEGSYHHMQGEVESTAEVPSLFYIMASFEV